MDKDHEYQKLIKPGYCLICNNITGLKFDLKFKFCSVKNLTFSLIY